MSRYDRIPRAGSDRANLYDEITGKIIAELEAGRFPWVQPWGKSTVKAPLGLPKKRAGVDNPNLRGAHLLRHSAATNMVRSGATLEAIGALLRHRSPDTTAIYAKVDTTMLMQVAQPWIGRATWR